VTYLVGVAFSIIALIVAGLIYEEIYNRFETEIRCESKLFRNHNHKKRKKKVI